MPDLLSSDSKIILWKALLLKVLVMVKKVIVQLYIIKNEYHTVAFRYTATQTNLTHCVQNGHRERQQNAKIRLDGNRG